MEVRIRISPLYLPSFHPHHELTILQGKGQYILFHGNLSVSENYEAAVWLITNVFSNITANTIYSAFKSIPGPDVVVIPNEPP